MAELVKIIFRKKKIHYAITGKLFKLFRYLTYTLIKYIYCKK